jgi:colanic acid/amylovoran biosynthesis protein
VRALILWAEPESTNLGVRALARGTERLLELAFGEVVTATQGFGPGDAPARIGTWRGQLKRLASRHDELVDWVRGFDIVVDTRAGDSFTDIYGMPRLATMTLMGEIVRRARVPMVLGPQTIGPFDSHAGRLLARRTLHTSRVVFARDDVSDRVARSLGRPADLLTTDVVFALEDVAPATRDRDVIINPSGLLWSPNSHVDSTQYRDIVTGLCRDLLARGRSVSLLAHVLDSPLADNDVSVVRELSEQFDGALEMLIPTGLDDARRMLSTAGVVVGSRMHACLNALSVGRPAIPLAYSRKFGPLLDGIGWSRTIDLRDRVPHVELVLAAIEDHTLEREVVAVRNAAMARIDQARDVLERSL